MKRLDRYIIFKFLGTLAFIMTLLMTVSMVFDVSEKLDDFLRTGPTLQEVLLDYYVNFALHYGNLFSPLIIFISLIFFTSQMAQRTEIVAILSSGVSFNRLLLPFFVAATILVGVTLYFNHFVIPKANKTRLAFEEKYYRNKFNIKDENLHLEIEEGTFVCFGRIELSNSQGREFSLEKWDEGEMYYKMTASSASLDTVSNRWTFKRYQVRHINRGIERIEQGAVLDTTINLTFEDFGRRHNFVSSMITPELNEFINTEKKKGSDKIPFYLLEKHSRTSLPIATYVLTLIGVSIATRKVRGGIGIHIAIGVLVVMCYIFAMKLSTVLATNAGMNALVSTWIPNVLFFFIALYLYNKAPK
jgi:lipopolysaccharide export system permease protein